MQVRDLVTQLGVYVEWKLRPVRAALNQADVMGRLEEYWQIMPQWNSSLFTNKVVYTVEKIVEPNQPLKVKILTKSVAEFNEPTKKMIEEAAKEGLPLAKFMRTGGPFQTNVQTKSLARYANQAEQIAKAQELFKMPEYVDDVHKKHIMLLQQSFERTLENLARIRDNGELVLVGKLPTVSTGWGAPVKTRGDMSLNIGSVYDSIVTEVSDFYNQLIEAITQAPTDGCDISISGLFHGILKGVRDDAEVIEASPDLTSVTIESGTRKTGVVPSSFAHNPGLDPAQYRRNEIWARYASEYTMLPFDNSTVVDIIGHRHATMPGDDPDELVWCSFDIGHQENSPRYTNRLEIPDPGKTLGADSIMMAGKLLKVYFTPKQEQYIIAMLESGAEFTMDWYLVLTGIFASWAKRNGLTKQDFRYMSIGDDLQLLIKRKHLPAFLEKFGPWLKAKGMKTLKEGKKTFHVAFLVGTFVARTEEEPDKIYAWVSPRHIKTTPGPKVKDLMAQFKPGAKPYLKVGEPFELETPEDQRKATEEYWKTWKIAVYYFGPVAPYLEFLQSRGFWLGRYLASQLGGGSEWLDEEMSARDMGTLTPARVPQQEPEVGGALPSRTLAPEGKPAGAVVEDATVTAKKKIALFGPPGSGKTSLIKRLVEKGQTAVDLEPLGTTAEERVAALTGDPQFVGGADVQPDQLPGYLPVLLLPPEPTYKEQVTRRNAEHPEKAGQNEDAVYASFAENRGKYALVLETGTLDDWANKLIDLVKPGPANAPVEVPKGVETPAAPAAGSPAPEEQQDAASSE